LSDPNDISEERAARYLEVQNSQEFAELRKKFRGFVFPMTGAFLAWYFLYVVLATYATDFMSQHVCRQHHHRPHPRSAAVRHHVRHHDVSTPAGPTVSLDPAAEKLAEHMERGNLSVNALAPFRPRPRSATRR
jgi:hypothetical protein